MGVRAGLSGPLARQRRRVRIPDGILGQPAHCIGVEVELHRKAAHRDEAILADVDPVLSSAGDSAGREVQWLGQVLAAIPSTIEHRVFPLGPTWSGR